MPIISQFEKEGKENPSTEIGQIFKSLRVFVITDFTILSQKSFKITSWILSLEKRKQCCYSSSTHYSPAGKGTEFRPKS